MKKDKRRRRILQSHEQGSFQTFCRKSYRHHSLVSNSDRQKNLTLKMSNVNENRWSWCSPPSSVYLSILSPKRSKSLPWCRQVDIIDSLSMSRTWKIKQIWFCSSADVNQGTSSQNTRSGLVNFLQHYTDKRKLSKHECREKWTAWAQMVIRFAGPAYTWRNCAKFGCRNISIFDLFGWQRNGSFLGGCAATKSKIKSSLSIDWQAV